jgi:integral membrane protein (TIGR01906 family)
VLGIAFALAGGLAVLLTGPLLLFNPWLVGLEQARAQVPARLGTTQAEVDRVTAEMLADLFLAGDFAASLDGTEPMLPDAERSHMRDVGGVVRALLLVELAAVLTLVLAGRRLRVERERRGRLLLAGAATVGTAALALGAFFALDFETAFTAFHAIFFPGGNWQFSLDSNLIRLFPEPLWFETALIAGASIVLAAVIVAVLARRDLRSVAG